MEDKKSDERRYACTHFFTFPIDGTSRKEEFFKKIIESSKSALRASEESKEEGKEDAEIYITLGTQAIESLGALLKGQKRAVFQDCEQYLMDVINGKDNVAFRIYSLQDISIERFFDHEIMIFDRHYSSNHGYNHMVRIEDDSTFSEE